MWHENLPRAAVFPRSDQRRFTHCWIMPGLTQSLGITSAVLARSGRHVALTGIALALPVERLMFAELGVKDHRQQARARPGPRAMTWNGAGGWVILSQRRQVNFSRTVWITFHCRGTTSSVSVMSSPSLASLPPQHGQALGAGITTRSRGRCAGNGARTGFLRVKPRTVLASAEAV